MKKVGVLLILYVIMIVSLSTYINAQEEVINTRFNLKEINSQKKISNVIAQIYVNEIGSIEYVDDGGSFNISVPKGEYDLRLIIDNLSTSGKNYFYNSKIITGSDTTKDLLLFQVGSVRAIVKDNLDNLIPYSELKFECNRDIGIDFPISTDKFGVFTSNLPVGRCTISAIHNEYVGIFDIEIAQGEFHNVEIELDKQISKKKNLSGYIFILVFIVIISLYYIFRYKNFNFKKVFLFRKEQVKNEKNISRILQNKRAQSIIGTLSDKEKIIVEFIAKNDKYTTQAKIHYAIGIPKASLFRYIQSLTNKNIIHCKKIGKIKRITFSEWFLERDIIEKDVKGTKENLHQNSL